MNTFGDTDFYILDFTFNILYLKKTPEPGPGRATLSFDCYMKDFFSLLSVVGCQLSVISY